MPAHAPARTLPMAPPVTGARAAEGMPPFHVPASHFAVALAWLGIGSAGLTVVAPALAAGAWLAPEVAVVAHAFGLGWLVTSAYGALYQLAPVALGVTPRSWKASVLTLLLHTSGVALIMAGFAGWRPWLLAVGWGVVAAGLSAWTWNLGVRLPGAPRARRSGRLTAAAFLFLWLATVLAGVRIGNALGWWLVSRDAIVGAHIHLAAVGFGTLLVMGIGSHILPMFLHSRDVPEWPLRYCGPVTALGVLLQAGGWLAGVRPLVIAGSLLAVAGVGLFLAQAARWFRNRSGRELDAALRQVVGALVMLAAAIALGLGALATGNPRLIGAYGVLLLVGWFAVLIGGVYARVFPFLTWLHRYSRRTGERGLPRVSDMLSQRWASAISAAWLTGVAILAAGVGLGRPVLAVAGALVFAGGTAGALILYARLLLRG